MTNILMKDHVLNIVLVEYINRNLGDTIIAECAKYFLEEALERANIKEYFIHEYNMYMEDKEMICRADLIVFAGGGLIKYKREYFWKYVPDIIKIAEENGIPVYINGTGVEGYDEADARCIRLKQAVNSSCVKGITIRDDYNIFKTCYCMTEKEWINKVLDVAAFSSEVYGQKQRQKGNKIGLGVVREGLFFDYGADFCTREFWLEFWKSLIIALEKCGYKWEIFTNGLWQDYQFAIEVLHYTGISECEKYMAKRPAEGTELVEIISGYQGVIACRLHTNIIAFSMQIPSIGLVWNKKMKQWGETIGYPERFIDAEDIQTDTVLSLLHNALEEGCRQCSDWEREEILHPLTEFCRQYGVSRRNRNIRNINFAEVFAAKAMSGKLWQYYGMNSCDMISIAYEFGGFRRFETDLKLTSDNRLVCVNGWEKQTYKILDVQPTPDMLKNGMMYSEFMGAKYYGHYTTMDYIQLITYMKQYESIKLVLDVREQDISQLQKIINIIKKSIQENPELKKRIIIKTALKATTEVEKLGIEIMYIWSKWDAMDNNSIFENENITWVFVRKPFVSPALIQKLKKNKKKISVSAYNSVSAVIPLLEWDVDMIETDYLSVSGLEKIL